MLQYNTKELLKQDDFLTTKKSFTLNKCLFRFKNSVFLAVLLPKKSRNCLALGTYYKMVYIADVNVKIKLTLKCMAFNSFLHNCTEHNDPILKSVIKEFGPIGYAVYNIIREILLGDEKNGFMYFFNEENDFINDICKKLNVCNKQKLKVKQVVNCLIKKNIIYEPFYNIGIVNCPKMEIDFLNNIRYPSQLSKINNRINEIISLYLSNGKLSQELINVWIKNTGIIKDNIINKNKENESEASFFSSPSSQEQKIIPISTDDWIEYAKNPDEKRVGLSWNITKNGIELPKGWKYCEEARVYERYKKLYNK